MSSKFSKQQTSIDLFFVPFLVGLAVWYAAEVDWHRVWPWYVVGTLGVLGTMAGRALRFSNAATAGGPVALVISSTILLVGSIPCLVGAIGSCFYLNWSHVWLPLIFLLALLMIEITVTLSMTNRGKSLTTVYAKAASDYDFSSGGASDVSSEDTD